MIWNNQGDLTHINFALIRFDFAIFDIFPPTDQYLFCCGRSNKIWVNWFPYLQTVLPKFRDVEEQGPLLSSSGGHGRFLKSFQPWLWFLFQLVLPWTILWRSPPRPVGKGNDQLVFHHYLLQLILTWTAMGDFLVFSALASYSLSSPSSLVTAGAAADRFCDWVCLWTAG